MNRAWKITAQEGEKKHSSDELARRQLEIARSVALKCTEEGMHRVELVSGRSMVRQLRKPRTITVRRLRRPTWEQLRQLREAAPLIQSTEMIPWNTLSHEHIS